MNQNLMNLEMSFAPDAYCDVGFKNVIEDHLLILRKDPETVVVMVTPMQLYKFEFDLTRLFRELGIRPELHWIVMRINGLQSMRDVPKNTLTILVPSLVKISRLLQSYRAVGKIN